MIKNRTAQLVYQTVFCTLGIVGFVASFGIFDDIANWRWDFYVHFTNSSNYFCIVVMFVQLIQTLKRKEDGYVTAIPAVKFIGILGILLTFVVFSTMIAGAPGRIPQLNWRVGSVLFHVVLPIMYVADWFLFYERRKAKWFYPFASVLFPLVYAILIFLQAIILKFDSSILIPYSETPLIYPYAFLNLEKLGILGVMKWIFAMFLVFVAVGYVFYGLDRIVIRRKKKDGEKDCLK